MWTSLVVPEIWWYFHSNSSIRKADMFSTFITYIDYMLSIVGNLFELMNEDA